MPASLAVGNDETARSVGAGTIVTPSRYREVNTGCGQAGVTLVWILLLTQALANLPPEANKSHWLYALPVQPSDADTVAFLEIGNLYGLARK